MKYHLILGCTVALVFLAQTVVAKSSTTTEEIAQTRTVLKENKLNDVSRELADYDRVIQLNPKNAEAYRNRGILKAEKLNDGSGALADFNKAIELNPKYALAHYARGVLKYAQLNDVYGALADFNKAIELDPKYVSAYNNRGILKAEKLNDLPGALADFNKAIEFNPKFAESYFNRGVSYGMLNDLSRALADYNRAIQLNPRDAKSYRNRGILEAEKLNDLPGALADFNKVIEINPKFAESYFNRGILKYTKLNDASGALADYNKAIELDPKDAALYVSRGNLKDDALHDIPGALVDYNKAIELNPKFAESYFNRGVSYGRLNDVSRALADYNKAIELNPKYALAYHARGILKAEKLKDRAGAIQDFRQADKLFREQGDTSGLTNAIEQLKKLGAIDDSLLETALKVPAADLARSYHYVTNILSMLSLAEAGATIQTPTQTINAGNAKQVREDLEKRRSTYETAINRRGYRSISGRYRAEATPSCDRIQSMWGNGIVQKIVKDLSISQDRFKIRLIHQVEIKGKQSKFEIPGIIVESQFTFDDPSSSDFSFIGTVTAGKIEVRPDVDSILKAWSFYPSWVGKAPGRGDLSSCVVTLISIPK